MEVEVAGVVLAKAEDKFFAGAVLVTFFSLQLSGFPVYLLLLWSCSAGLLCAYFLFRCIPRTPNLLLKIKHPSRGLDSGQHDIPLVMSCLVCNKVDCKRHSNKRREYLIPWTDLLVPSGVDSVISEFLELILRRYVYTWHRSLAPGSEAVEDELRIAIQHASSVVLRRLKTVDFPLLLSSKLLQPAATHIHYYMKARPHLPQEATIASIETAVLREYGECIHTAMKGCDTDLCYFRHVAHVLLPLVLPPNMIQSRIVCGLVEELFANKVFLPTMNIVAKPDFINFFILNVFDKSSRMEPILGPPSRDVEFLSKWAAARSRRDTKTLEISLPDLLHPQRHLYVFMQFMKAAGDICVMQLYLDLNDMKQKANDVDERTAPILVEQVDRMYREYLLPSSPNYLKLDQDKVNTIQTVLSSDSTPYSKCMELKNVFGGLRGHIYNELLHKIYYPRFLQSTMFYEHHLGKHRQSGEDSSKSKGHRWRQKTKLLKKMSQPSIDHTNPPTEHSADRADLPHGDGEEEEEEETDEEVEVESVPRKVQIVDAETVGDSIRPYTIYCIMVWRESGSSKVETVKRRFKEFVTLDTKLRHFHGDIHVSPPSKKAFKNLDKSFVDARIRELGQYLNALIGSYTVQRSRLLSSFLSPHSDPSLFLPDSVTEKMMKAMPNMLKRDKNQHVEDLLRTLLQSIEPPSRQASSDSIAHETKAMEKIQEERENYFKNVADITAQLESEKDGNDCQPLNEAVQMESVLDLLVFVAVTVYKVTPLQLTSLMLSKLLAQDTVEALVYKFATGRIELLSSEGHVIRLVDMLKKAIFFPEGKKRTEEDIMKRVHETLERLANYPNPVVVNVIGKERYRQGTALIVEGLQCMTLNKVLFFKFFDVILLELFPELQDQLNTS